MSEMGPTQAGYEIERLSNLAAQLGYTRSPDEQPRRTAPGTTAADVERYTELADQLGLTGHGLSSGAFPSLGR